MVKSINFVCYKKLKNIEMSFSPTLNIISGTNGTCKTSLLQIISNSYKAVTKKEDWVLDPKALRIINKSNKILNAKVEALCRGDKVHANPAPGHKGSLYTVFYENGLFMSFRRHDSSKRNRYSLKPPYGNNKGEKLPSIPTIYLGITRLYPIGEYLDDSELVDLKDDLPENLLQEIQVLQP